MILFSDSSGSGVHAHGKYRLKRLFFEKNNFNRDLSLQFSGLLRALFFRHGVFIKKHKKGCRMPSIAHYCDHLGELGFFGGFAPFLSD